MPMSKNGMALKPTFNKQDATCVSTLETVDNPDAEIGEQKGSLYILTTENTLLRYVTYEGVFEESNHTNDTLKLFFQAEWVYPATDMKVKPIISRQYDSDSWLLVTQILL